MVDTTRRVYVVDVQLDKRSQKDLRDIGNRLRSIESNGERAAKSMQKVGKQLNFAAVAAKAYAAVRIVSYVKDMSDAMTLLEARVKVVTDDTVGMTAAMVDLYDVASITRGSIESTADLYVRLAQAARGTATTHEDLIKVVTGISNALLLSGTSSQEAKALTVQLGQAFAKGKLDGDEFRSVMENSAIAGQLLADTLGVTRGALFQLSKEGKITRDVMNEAFGDGAGGLQKLVSDMPVTFDQAFTALGNLTKQFVSTFKGEMSAVAGVIKDVADAWTAALKNISENSRSAVQLLPGGEASAGLSDQLAKVRKLIAEEEKSFVLPGRTNETLAAYEKQEQALLGLLQVQVRAANSAVELKNEQAALDRAIRSGTYNESERQEYGYELLEKKEKSSSRSAVSKAQKETLTWQEQYRESLVASQTEIDRFTEYVNILDNAFFDGAISEDLYLEKLQELTGELKENVIPATKNFSEAMQFAIASSVVDGIGDMTDAIVDFAITGKGSFADMASSILADMSKMILKMVALNALKTAFSGQTSGFGGAINSLLTGSFATGTPYVPRDGLAYLHKGERVVPAAQNTTNNYSSTTEKPISIVNVTDPSQVAEVMSGGIGENIIINTIQRNPDLVRQVLA